MTTDNVHDCEYTLDDHKIKKKEPCRGSLEPQVKICRLEPQWPRRRRRRSARTQRGRDEGRRARRETQDARA
eukprot:464649-Pyramimonas_sp.AAC.1